MRRSIKLFLGMHEQLMKLLDKRTDFFFMRRPFLEDKSIEDPKIIELSQEDTEKEIANEIEIETLLKAMQASVHGHGRNIKEAKYEQANLL